MPPFVLTIIQALAASAAYDALRERARHWIPRPAPPSLEQSGGRARPPASIPGRIYPIARSAPHAERRR